MTAAVTVDPAQLRERLAAADPPRMIDVRTPAEFESAHIPGAHNVPLDLLRAHTDELGAHLGPEPVLICKSGQRADQAEKVLAAGGVSGARVLTGGMDGWRAAGGEVRRGRQTWELDRQVRFTAGLLVLIGLLASLLVPALVWFSAFIGVMLVITAALGICPMATGLATMPWNRGTVPVDVDRALADLRSRPPGSEGVAERVEGAGPRAR
jgi:rhodanese-related sulfurtransferase